MDRQDVIYVNAMQRRGKVAIGSNYGDLFIIPKFLYIFM